MDAVTVGTNGVAAGANFGAMVQNANAFKGMGAKAIAAATAKAGGAALLTGAIVGSQVGLAALGFGAVLYGGYKGGSWITDKVSKAWQNRQNRLAKEAFEKEKLNPAPAV